MCSPSWCGVPAESAVAFYAALPPERVAYYLNRWREASEQEPGPKGNVFRWHIAILEDLTGEPPTAPRAGTQYTLF